MSDDDILTAVAINQMLNETNKQGNDNIKDKELDIPTVVAINQMLNETNKQGNDNKKDEKLDTSTVVAINESLKKNINDNKEDSQTDAQEDSQTDAQEDTQKDTQEDSQTDTQKNAIYSSNNSMIEKLKALGFYIQRLNNNDIKEKIKKINDFKNDIQGHVNQHGDKIQFIKTLDSEKLYPVAKAPDDWEIPTVKTSFISLKNEQGVFKDDKIIKIKNIKPISYTKSPPPTTPTTPSSTNSTISSSNNPTTSTTPSSTNPTTSTTPSSTNLLGDEDGDVLNNNSNIINNKNLNELKTMVTNKQKIIKKLNDGEKFLEEEWKKINKNNDHFISNSQYRKLDEEFQKFIKKKIYRKIKNTKLIQY